MCPECKVPLEITRGKWRCPECNWCLVDAIVKGSTVRKRALGYYEIGDAGHWRRRRAKEKNDGRE